MESKRQQKVGRQIQKDLGDMFQKEAAHLLDSSLVTVTGVKVSPDLSIARAYVSILPDNKKQSVLESLKENSKFLRQKLGVRVRHQLRIVPEIHLYLDDTLEYVEKMDKLFSGLVIPPPGDDGTEGDYKL
ncbi:30S ribosome-binding factor RbfA [Ravibacter arvi]|uniref:Ribosome-binding factor A n=1 Tax=Ravibacter arvi TaxID=2051041 RepID=A0ABP8LKX2_9BACT